MRVLTVRRTLIALGALLVLGMAGACCRAFRHIVTHQEILARTGNADAHSRYVKEWLLAGPLPSSWSASRTRTQNQQQALDGFAGYLQAAHYSVNGEKLTLYCGKGSFDEKHAKSANSRYQHIINGKRPSRILVAANLYNNEQILPNMAAQLLELARILGPERLFISIYENGSQDRTKEMLHMLGRALLSLNIPHSIETDRTERPKRRHRIEYMAELRNRAMEPLYRNGSMGFDKVVFVNDVFFCAPDVLELIHQAETQNAHMTCAEDFVFKHGSLSFYDTWVARDMLGRAFKTRQRNIADDGGALAGQLHGRPFQVQCCWNGMSVIDARVFAGRKGIRFRRGADGECSASECSLLCNDMWARGFGRLVVVPRVKVSYEMQTRDHLRMPLHVPRSLPFSERQPEREIAFRSAPESVYCHPLNSIGTTVPDGVPSFVPLAG